MEDVEILDLIINTDALWKELKKFHLTKDKVRLYNINFDLLIKDEVTIYLSRGIEEVSRITEVPIVRKLDQKSIGVIEKNLSVGRVTFIESERDSVLSDKWAKFVSENESSII